MPFVVKANVITVLLVALAAACQVAPPVLPTPIELGQAATPGALQLTATAAPAGTLVDVANQFSFVPKPGWYVNLADSAGALSANATTLANYDLSVELSEAPLDGVTMDLIVYQRPADQSFGQFVLAQRSQVDTGEAGAPLGTSLTDLEFLTVGDYLAVQYLQIPPHADTWWLIYLDGPAGRVLCATIRPATRPEGQAAVAAAMRMLNTVVILPPSP